MLGREFGPVQDADPREEGDPEQVLGSNGHVVVVLVTVTVTLLSSTIAFRGTRAVVKEVSEASRKSARVEEYMVKSDVAGRPVTSVCASRRRGERRHGVRRGEVNTRTSSRHGCTGSRPGVVVSTAPSLLAYTSSYTSGCGARVCARVQSHIEFDDVVLTTILGCDAVIKG